MFEGLYFEFPKLAFLIFFYIACATLCRMKLPSIFFPHTKSFARETGTVSKLLFLLKWTGVVMLILALMSPVKDDDVEIEPAQGYDIALVLDASQSMSAKGFDTDNPDLNRFDVVKSIERRFCQSEAE